MRWRGCFRMETWSPSRRALPSLDIGHRVARDSDTGGPWWIAKDFDTAGP